MDSMFLAYYILENELYGLDRSKKANTLNIQKGGFNG